MSEHARLAPSAASKWIPCAGSLAMEEAQPPRDDDSEFSREGTAAHQVAQWSLTDDVNRCEAYIARKTDNGWKVTEDMADDTQTYVDNVIEYAEGNILYVERKVDLSNVVGVTNTFGTSDAIIIADFGKELQCHDLKFGRGIMVYAEGNEQLMLYALGALEEFELLGNFQRVRLVIHQPRLNHLSEWTCSIEEIRAFAAVAKAAAQKAVKIADDRKAGKITIADILKYLNPGDKQCQWCKAAGKCDALAQRVTEIVGAQFEDLSMMQLDEMQALVPKEPVALSEKMGACDMLETFIKAVRAEVEHNVLGGIAVPGWKLVMGKQGNRKWNDEDEAEKMLKSFRLKSDEIYNMKLISPTTADKRLSKENPKRWNKLQPLISRSEGKPSVAPEYDKRDAIVITPVAELFSDETGADLV